MENSIFDRLLKNAEKDHDFSLDTIGFNCEIGNYKINFYATAPFKQLFVQDFGYTHKGEWVQMKPTQFQMEKMFELIKLETFDYYDEIEKEMNPPKKQEYVDPYTDNGVDPRIFF